jgi:formylglycine-generating enzyme required for sulfatase activity
MKKHAASFLDCVSHPLNHRLARFASLRHTAKLILALNSVIQVTAIAVAWMVFSDAALAQASPAEPAVPGIAAHRPSEGRFVAVDSGFLVPYTETIPGTEVTFDMVPIPGGEFVLGSPDSEVGRSPDEGPQVRVRIAPFWIGRCEVTWAEYRAYMATYDTFKQLQRLAAAPAGSLQGDVGEQDRRLVAQHAWNGRLEDAWGVDAVTSATPLYDASYTYSAGENPNQPAVTMTQFAARQYTKWLSGVTGRGFRLPTEAEWEYAARAGTTTAYSFGDSGDELGDYAWFESNGDFQTHAIGTRTPNRWGLFDMHGNVAEWTLDEYAADAYQALGNGPVDASAAVRWPTKLFPRVIRGGSWLEPAERCRSAARQKSEEDEWKLSDPNIPLSPWWYTEEPATAVGMRIVRSLKPLTKQEKQRAWEPDVPALRDAVGDRLQEGRGAVGVADQTLPAAAAAVERFNEEP